MKNTTLTVLFIALTFLSCSKSETSGSGSTSSPFTLKYEIICDKSITTTYLGQPFLPTISYINGTGQAEFSSTFTSGTTWTKTITVTDTRRPFLVMLGADGLSLTSSGNVIANLYVNGVKKATSTNPTIPVGTLNTGIVNLNYSIN